MSLKFHDVDDTSHPAITVSGFLSQCLLVPKGYYYRGQGDRAWKLVPSIFRDSHGSTITSVLRTRRLRYFTEGSQFEVDFQRLLALGGPGEEVVVPENAGGYGVLTKLAFFQHFGVPTPLLDWTYSPLIALFMSIFERPTTAGDVSIFRVDPTAVPNDVTFQPYDKIHFRRIQTQLGAVMFFGNCTKTDLRIDPHVYDEYIAVPGMARFVEKINVRIEMGDIELIRNALGGNGIREDLIFPRSIQWVVKRIIESMQ
jgi:hypothetical protein